MKRSSGASSASSSAASSASSAASSASKDGSDLNMKDLELLRVELSHKFQANFPQMGKAISSDFSNIMTDYYHLTILIASVIFKENNIPLKNMKLKIPSGLGDKMDGVLKELKPMFSSIELHKRRGEFIPKIGKTPILVKYNHEILNVEKQLIKSLKVKDLDIEKKTKIIEFSKKLNLHLQILQKNKDVKLFEDAFKLFYAFIVFLLSTTDKEINSFDDILGVDIQMKLFLDPLGEFSILYKEKVEFEKETNKHIDDFGFLLNSEFTEKEVKSILFVSHHYWEKYNPSLAY